MGTTERFFNHVDGLLKVAIQEQYEAKCVREKARTPFMHNMAADEIADQQIRIDLLQELKDWLEEN